MPQQDYQRQFFQDLAQGFPSRTAMSRAVGDLLGLEMATVNRRISGATQLRIDELITLAQHFGIALPDGRTEGTPFLFNNNQKRIQTPADYLDQISDQLETVDRWPDKQLYYASADLPIFYELNSPTLLAFKLYVFGRSSWGFEQWKSQAFQPEMIDPKVIERAAAISHYAFRVPTRELWSSAVLSTTINQIEYIALTGKFADSSLPLRILDELSLIVNHVEDMALNQQKFAPGENAWESDVPYALYYNELFTISTTIYVHSPAASLLFVSLLTPNFLVTNDVAMGDQVREWFDAIFREATELGQGTQKYLSWFFHRLRARIAGAKKRLEEQGGEEGRF